MTTSSQLVPTFILRNYFSHTQLPSLMRAFCFPAFFNKHSINPPKPLSVTGIPRYAKNMTYLGFITVPNDAPV